MKTKLFFLCCAILFIGALGISFAAKKEKPLPTPQSGAPTSTFSQTATYWEKRIAEVGAKVAYKEFSLEALAQTPDQQRQHFLSHRFGEALYKEEGLKGMGVCDDQFTFGCFHEFVGQALSDTGVSTVQKLNAECGEYTGTNFIICQHGLGHGIAGFFGYTEKNLTQALDICRTLQRPDNLALAFEGCYGGVFMEYNGRSMLGEEGTARPLPDTKDFLSPCTALAAEYQPACYFRQARWWVSAVFMYKNTLEIYPRMGEMCDAISDRNLREDCFSGIGAAASGPAYDDATNATTMCSAATKNKTYQLLCMSFAAFGVVLSGDEGRALAICASLPKEAKDYCEIYAKGGGNISKISLPAGY